MYAVFSVLLYLPGLGRPPLWEPDEGRYAEIPREMLVAHDYVTPRNNFIRYFEKPPLVYWLTAGSMQIFGHNEFAVRLQSAMASVGQVVITAILAEGMYGVTAGMFAALALALSPLFFVFARAATPDPALALFMTAAMACFYHGAESAGPPGIQGLWMVAAAGMLALGTLTKGPVAPVLGGAIALLWLLLEGRRDDLWRMPWLKCVALYLALTLPWFIIVERRNPGFLHFFVVHEHFERYVASTEHGWGPWFYLLVTIAGTWPWFYFTPLGLTSSDLPALPRWRFAGRVSAVSAGVDSRRMRERRAAHFLLIWFGVILVFFSIPRSKLGEYILPGLPPLAILAGRGLARFGEISATERRWLLVIFAALNAAAATAIAVAMLVAGVESRLSFGLAGDGIVAAIALLAAGIAAFYLGRTRSRAAGLVMAAIMIVAMGAGIDARDRVAPLVSYRKLARTIVPYTSRGCRLMSYRHFEQAMPFYTGVRETLVDYRGELEPFGPFHDPTGNIFATDSQLQKAWSGDQCVVLVANRLDLPILIKQLAPAPVLLGCEGKKLALYNRPLDEPARAPQRCLNPATNAN